MGSGGHQQRFFWNVPKSERVFAEPGKEISSNLGSGFVQKLVAHSAMPTDSGGLLIAFSHFELSYK